MTSTSIQSEVESLAGSMRNALPGARVEFTPFDSGAAMLDVFSKAHHYILTYFPSQALFGVDEVEEDTTPFDNFYRFCYPDFDSAAKQLWALVKGEVQVSANGVAQ
jgi:hypothetical protein